LATLHVRNVPDALYESLRRRAAANGRSIGAELVVMLEGEAGVIEHHGQLGVDLGMARTVPHPGLLRRRPKKVPFEYYFNPRARQALAAAQEEAVPFGAASVGSEHLLLALLREPPNLASVILRNGGVTYDGVRSKIETETVPVEPQKPGAVMPFTAGAKQALELSLRESINLRAIEIGPEHLLLGIARSDDGIAARILCDAGLDGSSLRQALRSIEFPPGLEAPYGFSVVELAGEAADWERALNHHATQGHQLVEIVDRRAIFRVPMT
jgi:ATP-dependent Clp protease ATP-binding subunit ClpC